MTAGNCHCSQDQTQITPSWQSNGISLYTKRPSLLRENMTDRTEKVFHVYLWTSPVQEWQRQPQPSRWHNASGWCWSCGASGARFWWGQTCDLRDTSSIQSRSFKLSIGQKDRTEAHLNSSDWVVDSHVCQLMTVGILSLVTPSDANYTIIARLHSGCNWQTIDKKEGWNNILAERIHFQKHPDQNGEYHRPSHEEYEQQLFLYPRTLRWSGDLKDTIKHEHRRKPTTTENGCI